MKLHTLEVTAFGPFTDTVTVDLDALGSAGIFLLTGPTGAGKSSVLDAVCFALYGDVPGDRAAAKRLRSDGAPPDRAPRVVLEVTLGGRRFRIDRSPAWRRPKRRGSGTTQQQATVAVTEHTHDRGWITRSTRIDESAHLIGSLLGLTLPQFCQVALLPQGQFQAFLRARSEDRHALLARVFRTGRFEDVERWLRERRAATRRSAAELEQQVRGVLSRISETADRALPAECHDLAAVPAHVVEDWSSSIAHETSAALHELEAGLAETRARESAAGAAREAGLELERRRSAHVEATRRLGELDAEGPVHGTREERLAAARRAAPVAPLLALATTARADLDAAEESARSVTETTDALAARSAGLAERLAVVRAVRPRERELAELERDRDRQLLTVERARVARADALEAVREQPHRVESAQQSVAEADRAAASLPGVESEVAGLQAQVEARADAAELLHQREQAEEWRVSAVATAQDLKESWLQVRESRLDGMAAELALDLAAGETCPVCGSAEHPTPARHTVGAPGAEEERWARAAHDDAETERHAREEHCRDLDRRIAATQGRAGDGSDAALAAAVADASARQQGLRDLLADRDRRADALASARERLGQLSTAAEIRSDELHTAQEALSATHARVHAVRDEVRSLLDDTAHDRLVELEAELEESLARCRAAERAVRARDLARKACAEAEETASAAALGAGFADVRAAAEAGLGTDAVRELEAAVDAHRRARAHAESVLADPEVRAAAEQPAPDLERLGAVHAETVTTLRAAERDHAVLSRRHKRLETLLRDLRTEVAAWGPARRDHDLAASLTALVDGSSPDNRLRMRLSAYVLAARLSQVVEAANERLAGMSDERYRLEHTGHRGAGETRGGLSLLVRDDWSGESRDPATLSGGETFVVSLALALGLADVIAHEAGGADLDTLFVDEGFGALDAETLDHVLDHLDGLREGGRVVGVVSHVEEMRDRIPAQLRVSKGRAGSTLSVPAPTAG